MNITADLEVGSKNRMIYTIFCKRKTRPSRRVSQLITLAAALNIREKEDVRPNFHVDEKSPEKKVQYQQAQAEPPRKQPAEQPAKGGKATNNLFGDLGGGKK